MSGRKALRRRPLKKLSPFVKYLHIKDALEDGSIVPAGKGIGHLKEILAQFRQSGGNHVSLEPHLVAFDGLNKLENQKTASKVGFYSYPSAAAAFQSAADALRALI